MEAFSIWKKRIFKKQQEQDAPMMNNFFQNLLIKQEILMQENALQKKIIKQLKELNSSMSTLSSYRYDSSLSSGRSSSSCSYLS